MVVAQLRMKTQFHRFEFLNGMLRSSIGHHLLPGDKVERDLILHSVVYRHDCVHRNGRDVEGNILFNLTVDYLILLAGHFSRIVAQLATVVEERQMKQLIEAIVSAPEINLD